MGYAGLVLGGLLQSQGWRVVGTARNEQGCAKLESEGFKAVPFDGEKPSSELKKALDACSHLLNSIPPGPNGDPLLNHHSGDITRAALSLTWLGLLSTIGVYGDHQGGWVDEDTRPAPLSKRSQRRLEQEDSWRGLEKEAGMKTHIFRLPGIYGPGRSPLDKIRAGKARRIVKKGQYFNRIHVDDLARALFASMRRPDAGHLFNICDDEPAPPEKVTLYAARLLGVEPPSAIPYEEAKLSPMARSFYLESKRVDNRRMKEALKPALHFPTYRQGLADLLAYTNR
jgi:nucleoside-diphosphate-sugar epimerase